MCLTVNCLVMVRRMDSMVHAHHTGTSDRCCARLSQYKKSHLLQLSRSLRVLDSHPSRYSSSRCTQISSRENNVWSLKIKLSLLSIHTPTRYTNFQHWFFRCFHLQIADFFVVTKILSELVVIFLWRKENAKFSCLKIITFLSFIHLFFIDFLYLFISLNLI